MVLLRGDISILMNGLSGWTSLLDLSTLLNKELFSPKHALTLLTCVLEKNMSRLVRDLCRVIYSSLIFYPPSAQTPLTQYFLQQGVRMYAFAFPIQSQEVRR